MIELIFVMLLLTVIVLLFLLGINSIRKYELDLEEQKRRADHFKENLYKLAYEKRQSKFNIGIFRGISD